MAVLARGTVLARGITPTVGVLAPGGDPAEPPARPGFGSVLSAESSSAAWPVATSFQVPVASWAWIRTVARRPPVARAVAGPSSVVVSARPAPTGSHRT